MSDALKQGVVSGAETLPADGTVSYTLSRPIQLIDRTVTTITLREPLGRDLAEAGDPKNAMVYSQRLIEKLAGLVTGTCNQMAARDVIALGKIVGHFLGDDSPEPS